MFEVTVCVFVEMLQLLNYTPFLNPKKSSESLLEPLSKIMCIMVSFLSFYIIRSEMLNYCFHGNGGNFNGRLFLVSTSL
jgi:hypothetical protein